MIIRLILKNLRIILRNPFTILFLIVAPMLLMFIVGIAYSGSTLSNINIGISGDSNFLTSNENSKINYIPYSEIKICDNNLRASKVDFCVDINLRKDQLGNILSANVIYDIDNSRSELSNLLVNLMDNIIKKKTKTITKKTVSNIFSGVKETVTFMENSLVSINSLENNLTFARKRLETFNVTYNLLLSNFKNHSKIIKENSNNITSKINKFSIEYNVLKSDLIVLKSKQELLSNTIEQLDENNKVLNSLVESYANEVNTNISSYISTSFLKNFTDSISLLDSYFKEYEDLIGKIDLNSLNDLNNLSESYNDLFDKMNKLEVSLDDGNKELSDLILILKGKELELNLLKIEITDKLTNFKKLSSRDESEITEPIVILKNNALSNYKMVHKLAPMIVMLVLLFIGLLLSSIIVSIEVNSKAYFRNLISPVKQYQFVIALFFTSLIIVLFQVGFLLFILSQYFGIVNIYFRFFAVLFVIVHLLTIFILLGMLIAYYFLSLQFSILFTTFIMLFLFLLSGVVVPLELMPVAIANILYFNPIVLGEKLIRIIFNFKTIGWFNFSDFIIIYFQILILILVLSYAVIRRKKKLF